ncbi:MAG: LysR substrate-binding domain-containing protein [Pseudomonadota bacterium]
MSSYRHRLPPLDALLVFEAVVRCGGLTKAAAELNVTQAAVSKRIKGLEDLLGTRLLTRAGRTVFPTNAGRLLNEKVDAALDFLDEACTVARGQKGANSVSISGDTAVSHYWLRPSLRSFGREHPSIAIRLVTSDLTADLVSDDNDIAILYGTGERPGWHFAPLFGQDLVPVASPAYLERSKLLGKDDRAVLETAALLDHDRKEPHWTDWHVWLTESGFSGIEVQANQTFNSYALAIDAAVNSQGVALASLPLLNDLLNRNILCPVTTAHLVCRKGFFLGRRKNKELSVEAQLLHDWLLTEAGAQTDQAQRRPGR